MPSCCYPDCKMSFRTITKNHLGVKFYAFPANQTRKLIWLEAWNSNQAGEYVQLILMKNHSIGFPKNFFAQACQLFILVCIVYKQTRENLPYA